MNDDRLAAMAMQLRRNVVRMIGPGQTGHMGGSFSLAEIVAALYFTVMRHRPDNPDWPERDRFILSKGHAALIQYAALAECGYFPTGELDRVKTLGSMLQGHPDLRKTPGVEANTGSLGQGLSIACGIAQALRLDGIESRVFCVLGDGEIAEGQVWEAATTAAFRSLSNLVAILDFNGVQAMGFTRDRYDQGDVPGKWRACGWRVQEIDGHSIPQILDAFAAADGSTGRPECIIARTVKGKGFTPAENNPAFHNGMLTTELYHQACLELANDRIHP